MCSRDFLPGGETGFAEVEPPQVCFGANHQRVGDQGGGEVVGASGVVAAFPTAQLEQGGGRCDGG